MSDMRLDERVIGVTDERESIIMSARGKVLGGLNVWWRSKISCRKSRTNGLADEGGGRFRDIATRLHLRLPLLLWFRAIGSLLTPLTARFHADLSHF